MTHLDSDNPATPRFARNGMPVMDARPVGYFPPSEHNRSLVPTLLSTRQYVQQPHMAVQPTGRTFGCACDELSLGRQWPEAHRQVPLWVAAPTWNREWTEGEIRKEECRRLCWSTLMLISGHTSYAAAINIRHSSNFFVMEPSNVRYLATSECSKLTQPLVFDLVSWGVAAIFAITNICRWRRREAYGLGAVSSCDATLERMYTGAVRCNYQRSRQDRICDANMDGDRGDRKGIATAHVRYREGIHV
jgi:hypothetical protein